jgi:sodium/calcium exchanger protein
MRLLFMPRRYEPPLFAVGFQTLASLGVIIAGAHFFVDAVEHAAAGLGLPAGLIALILAPLATELPEKFNSIFWIRQGHPCPRQRYGRNDVPEHRARCFRHPFHAVEPRPA